MVCKEDVLTWFKDAASYKRIDVMCALLHMCIPFELRFLGACLEERGKQDYQELRGAALVANSRERLVKELCGAKGVLDKCTRHRLTVYVSLLQSRNYTCAQWLYNGLLRSDALDALLASGAYAKDVALHTELLLLYTMALNHPAFTFDPKRYFDDVVTRLTEFEAVPCMTQQQQQQPPPCPPGLGYTLKAALPVHHLPLAVAEPPMPPPPGIPLPAVQGLWSRTHFLSSAPPPPPPPELAPFPPPVSPLVSQHSSPTSSRSVSPSRLYAACRPPPATLLTHMDRLLPPPPAPTSVKDATGGPQYGNNTDLKSVPMDEDTAGDKSPQQPPWLESTATATVVKLPNGLLAAKCPALYLAAELQPLQLEGGGRCSSSSASSSDGHSPPDTPTGPGRGGRGPPGLQDAAAFSANCTVPYTAHYSVQQPQPPPAATAFHPSRTMYYGQAYRPHQFPAPPPPPAAYPQQNGELPYLFPPHYLPMLYSSAAAAPPPPPPPPAKLATCYNCGVPGHAGADCNEPTIEEITQKKGYQLEYTTPPPDVIQQQPPPAPPSQAQPQSGIVDKQQHHHHHHQQQQQQQPNQQQ